MPGGSLFIAGSGFAVGSSVVFLWDGSTADWLSSATTDEDGAFDTAVSLPEDVEPGEHLLVARDAQDAGADAREVSTEVEIEAAAVAIAPVKIWYEPSDLITPPTRPAVKPSSAPVAEAPTPASTPDPATPTTPSIASVPPVVGVAGYGAGTKGGTAGQVIAVTNLNDSGAGSLRAAVDASGPRTVVFRVGGTINLGGDLRVDDPFLTIDGSTAPGPVVVRGGMLVVTTHDVIVRQLRFRPGDQVGSPADVDAVSLIGLRGEVYNVVLDHLTMIWGPDIGGLSILGNVHDVTVQYSIMGEGLYHSAHPESGDTDGHSMGTSVFQLDPGVAWPKRITFHHNLFTTSSNRMPVIQGAECVDLVNNVIYNWGFRGLTGNPRGMNVVNNWFRSGPDTTSEFVYQWQPHAGANPNAYANSVYVAGNTADGFAHAVEAPSNVMRGSLACGGLSVAGQTSQAGYDTVISAAGATLPVRDGVDQRIIANVINRSGQLFNGAGYSGPNPYYP